MKEGNLSKKLRSQVTCKPICNPRKDFINSSLIDTNVRKFLASNSQLSCDKINSQTFRKPKPNSQIIQHMQQLANTQKRQYQNLMARIRKHLPETKSNNIATINMSKVDNVQIDKEQIYMESQDNHHNCQSFDVLIPPS